MTAEQQRLDQARSRAYGWGEDGLAGISDDHQVLCFALALWNGSDPILKERLFGLTKYPQAAYPYEDIVTTNARRSRQELAIGNRG